MKVQIYADVVCPWCYIGALRFKRALHSYPELRRVEVCYLPFQLEPDAPPEPEPIERRLRQKYGRHAVEMMRSATDAAHAEGAVIRLDQALAVNTFDAHRLLQWALETHGPETQFNLMHHLYRAYFEHGANIADHGELAGIAAEAGLDRDAVKELLNGDDGVETLESALEEAPRLGVTAVPTFVFAEKYALQGAQPPAVFLQVLNDVAAAA
jgi:predicted DsbA family dithiol-disulfide isomerase